MTKTKKVLTSVSATIFALGMTGCGSEEESTLPPAPTDDRCDEYEWNNEEGVYQCDDDSSSYHGNYFYGGFFFASLSSLKKDSSYKNYRNSTTFESNTKPSKGFGSGSSYTGG